MRIRIGPLLALLAALLFAPVSYAASSVAAVLEDAAPGAGAARWIASTGAGPVAEAQEPGRPAEARVVVVPIVGTIGVRTTRLVQRALSVARETGAQRLILEIDTPGGLVTEMREIETILAGLRGEHSDRGIHVSAFVRRHALSAGGYLALACEDTYMAPGASIGAITPVEVGPEGIRQIADDDARRKLLSAFRADVRSLVERRGNAGEDALVIAEAMVDPRMEIVEVTYVDANGFEKTRVVETAELQSIADRGLEILRQEPFGTTPLTLTAAQALRFGLAKGVHDTIDDVVREEFGLAPGDVVRVEENWSESAVAWLERIKPILFLLGFLLLLVEAKAPGTMIPATLGILLIGLGLFSSYLVGLADWTEILLFFLGLGLIGVEIFVMPGTFLFGLAGFAAVLIALVLSQQTFVVPETEQQVAILTDNLLHLLYLVLLTMAGGMVLQRLLPRVPFFNRVLLTPPADKSRTGDATRFAREQERAGSILLGAAAVAATDLRPAGIAELADGTRHDVVADGSFLRRGTRLRIVRVEGNRIVVVPDEGLPDQNAPGGVSAGSGGESGAIAYGLLILLVIVGLGLVVAEVFFVSGGLLSVASAVALLSAIFLAFTQHGQGFGLFVLSLAAVGVPAALVFSFKLLPRTAIGRKIILSGPDSARVRGKAQEPGLDALLGHTGVALSMLRPSGYARIDGRRIDVVTRGELIEGNTPIRVIGVDGNRVVVAEDRTSS
ncbi:MAG: hypothetical protein IPM29_12630 [Planctomycetes bacterium]|nr:hypothetical protein [Planctomycetota bacterium]